MLPFQNGSQTTDFRFVYFDFSENLKNYFPKEIFQWNLAHNRRSWIFVPVCFMGKTFFPHPMLIYAN